MEWEYKIAHWNADNEWSIFRTDWEDAVQWLSPEHIWTSKKKRAMKFINEQDAVSALTVIKFKWELKTEEEYIDEKISEEKTKTTRWEL